MGGARDRRHPVTSGNVAGILTGWIYDVIACPQAACAGRLRGPAGRGAGVARCGRCGSLYPVLAGIPVAVPAPAHWVAAHRDGVLAALAEHGAATRAAVAVVREFAAAAPDAEPVRFGDDWLDAAGATPPGAVGAALASLAGLPGPDAALDDAVPGRLGTVLDLGAGAGDLAARLRRRAARVVVADLSLRAVLRARKRAGGGAAVAGAVVDADQLGLARGRLDAAFAANLIDLIDAPEALLEALAHGVRRGGRVALSTPQPGLGDPDDDPEALRAALGRAGFRIDGERDGVPWLRAHRARYVQVYTCWVVAATKGSRRR